MSFETVLYAVNSHVATITLNRPLQMNAFNQKMRIELHDALQMANADGDVRVVIFTGAGQCLSAGTDLAEASESSSDELDRIIGEEFYRTFMAITRSEKPYICAFRGAAVGIATAYALTCDMTIMSEQSYMYQAFSDIGLVPDGGLTWHFVRTLGYKRAFRFLADPIKISPKDCVDNGLATMVVPDDLLDKTAQDLAHRLAGRSGVAHALLKKALHHAMENDLESSIKYEVLCQKQAAESSFFRSAVAAFLNKRLRK